MEWTCNDESFFRIFEFSHLMHSAIDYGIVYELITITQNIITASGYELRIDDQYHQMIFSFKDQTFTFASYESVEEYDRRGSKDGILQYSKVIVIPQAELAPFLVW